MFQGASVTVREQILGLSFLLFLCGLQGLNSVCRAYWQVPLLAETSCLDLEVFRSTCLSFYYHSRFFCCCCKNAGSLEILNTKTKKKVTTNLTMKKKAVTLSLYWSVFYKTYVGWYRTYSKMIFLWLKIMDLFYNLCIVSSPFFFLFFFFFFPIDHLESQDLLVVHTFSLRI